MKANGNNYAEENISTEIQPPPRQKARLSRPDGDQERTRRDQTPPRQRTQEINSPALLDLSLPKEARLLKRADFLRVYENGKRFEGRFMTVFILHASTERHRVGITATKKANGKAHDRNRAKRLLRESFRLSRAELDVITAKYDWVLNARRSILRGKLEQPLAEFRLIVAKMKAETRAVGGVPCVLSRNSGCFVFAISFSFRSLGIYKTFCRPFAAGVPVEPSCSEYARQVLKNTVRYAELDGV